MLAALFSLLILQQIHAAVRLPAATFQRATADGRDYASLLA
jgi:hypothetical protein